jgi:hypothetical protein
MSRMNNNEYFTVSLFDKIIGGLSAACVIALIAAPIVSGFVYSDNITHYIFNCFASVFFIVFGILTAFFPNSMWEFRLEHMNFWMDGIDDDIYPSIFMVILRRVLLVLSVAAAYLPVIRIAAGYYS